MSDNPFGDMIYSYSRADALNDGVLVDVSETAREAGIIFPTAMTIGSYAECVGWDNDVEKVYQDVSGRLWDVVFMLTHAIKSKRNPGSQIHFKLMSVPRGETEAVEVELKAIIGPGDEGEPVMTILLPHED